MLLPHRQQASQRTVCVENIHPCSGKGLIIPAVLMTLKQFDRHSAPVAEWPSNWVSKQSSCWVIERFNDLFAGWWSDQMLSCGVAWWSSIERLSDQVREWSSCWVMKWGSNWTMEWWNDPAIKWKLKTQSTCSPKTAFEKHALGFIGMRRDRSFARLSKVCKIGSHLSVEWHQSMAEVRFSTFSFSEGLKNPILEWQLCPQSVDDKVQWGTEPSNPGTLALSLVNHKHTPP